MLTGNPNLDIISVPIFCFKSYCSFEAVNPKEVVSSSRKRRVSKENEWKEDILAVFGSRDIHNIISMQFVSVSFSFSSKDGRHVSLGCIDPNAAWTEILHPFLSDNYVNYSVVCQRVLQ